MVYQHVSEHVVSEGVDVGRVLVRSLKMEQVCDQRTGRLGAPHNILDIDTYTWYISITSAIEVIPFPAQ